MSGDRNAGKARPNILLVTVDQWPAHLLGAAGHRVIETPTLDHLARLGTRYTNVYAECPICIPARRTLMTGLSPRGHGDRDFQPLLPMPEGVPTLAQVFREGGYQTSAVGKLHVYPQRDRIGFEEVLLAEEGRAYFSGPDDYDLFLADRGAVGRQFLHGMSNNDYGWRPWHLPEELHVTNWITFAAARQIKRRDPTRPALWYVSYTHPHPPLVPLQSYLERYRDRAIDEAAIGKWAEDFETLPFALKHVRAFWASLSPERLAEVRRAFYALCTQIDHQIRILVGTLAEEGLLDDTAILVTSDHGDMLGDHGLFAKRLMYEASAKVPLILVPGAGDPPATPTDDRLAGLQDVMPTLLDLAGLAAPGSCEGRSLRGPYRRPHLYAESLSGAKASRMVRDARWKLVWYPAGNVVQLFDLAEDPRELHDRAGDRACADVRAGLEARLLAELYGTDCDFARDGRLEGMPAPPFEARANRDLSGQRGLHYPPIPIKHSTHVVGTA